jgi:hypothetical protein
MDAGKLTYGPNNLPKTDGLGSAQGTLETAQMPPSQGFALVGAPVK